MDPIGGAVEKEAVGWLFSNFRKLWSWHTDVVKENKRLKNQLDEKLEFQRQVAEMTTRQEDDNLYRSKDGRYFCPICIHKNKEIVPVVNHFEGSYFCVIHKHVFETEARRLGRAENPVALRIKRRRRGPHDWMAR